MRALAAVLLVACACTGAPPEASSPTPTRATETPSPTRTPIPELRLRRVATFEQPIAMAVAGDDVWVAEKTGRVRALDGGRVVLDLRGEVSGGYEQGLLGIAVRDDRLYVDYTNTDGDTRVVEYAIRAGRADGSSARTILAVDQPYANHNGGAIAFGPDGYLYVALGDGGSAGDPHGNAQSLGTLLGKILRIDPARGDPYAIPDDNPFADRAGARGEIWSYGLRNPWRFSFDRATGDMWIGDVGQGAREEVDHEPAGRGGRNYGWDRFEGTRPFEGGRLRNHTPPVHEYPTTEDGNCAVTGGYVYRGDAIPGLDGWYVFADHCAGAVMALSPAQRARSLGLRAPLIASFGEDARGELYVLSLEGGVFRIEVR